MITAKMSAFSSPESFMSTIVNNFKPEGDNGEESNPIKNLAFLLYKRLFQNPDLTPDCHGTFEKRKHVEPERRELSIKKELDAYELLYFKQKIVQG
ncbi:hypothetical protein GGI03_005077 [Coemansia sp. RSA 2337]|nr:hypothetical protein GGI03_005077 [Coemansia sp. RSA 2337]